MANNKTTLRVSLTCIRIHRRSICRNSRCFWPIPRVLRGSLGQIFAETVRLFKLQTNKLSTAISRRFKLKQQVAVLPTVNQMILFS